MLLSSKKIDVVGNDVAAALLARDYKGFGCGQRSSNAVIEWKQDE